ncbi:non-ribosomal peptide synthetase [Thermoactinospora rubra]|uniref:non-ribosomal peptide synthetase n=1 Tax=Thermoactinospora rubra TaxID=1088767 RepID=UPI000A1015A4|nr:non-ribosomal peptide synthetase [Thermoactinospora rubra]
MPTTRSRTTVLSPGQERLWFLDRLSAGDASYNIAVAERFAGRLDAGALERAFAEIVARHEALRTVFPDRDGVPVAEVRPAAFSLERVDATPERLPALLAERANRPFNLAAGPLVRVSLVRLGDLDHVLLVVLHHIVADAWSLERILYPELGRLYAAFASGRPAPPAPPAPPYGDYARRQRERDHGEDLAFWRAELEAVPTLELPADRTRPAVRSGRGGLVVRRLPRELWTGVAELARAERCTPYMVLLAACQALLARHSGQDDFCVGTPIAGRDQVEDEGVFGLFVNTLAIRADVGGDPAVRELLKRVRRRVLRAFAHAAVPFEQVVAELRIARDPSTPPLCQVLLNLDNPAEGRQDDGYSLSLAGLEREPVPSGLAPAKADLALDVVVHPDALTVMATYSAELFDRDTVERMAGHFHRLLADMAERPGARVSELRMLPPEEQAVLVATSPIPPPPGRLEELIARQAARTPDAPAVVTPDGTLSYAELDRRAEAVAGGLAARGVGRGSRVALCLRASPDAVVALLAVLRRGAAYVPLDPAQPRDRLASLLGDCGAVLAVVPEDHDGLPVPAVTVAALAEGASPAAAPEEAHVDDPAYVIYTSGSTGTPKGVVVAHRTVARLAAAFRDLHGFGPGQRVLMVPPLSFDASAGDIFPALISGAALVLHPEPASLTGPDLLALCADLSITMVDTASALWQQWVAELTPLGRVDPGPLATMMVGGESVPLERLRAWAELTGGTVAFYNHYGPTEATVCATAYRTVDGRELADRTHLPIGTPLPHVRAYVLNNGTLAPIGAPGELHLGGGCLALGYLDRPEETAARFLPDPFVRGARMYATGDLVRRRADGVLEFLGRTDRQLKVNGNRVEPGEIESACLAHPAIREAVVTAHAGRLVAYLVGDPISAAGLRGFLGDRLPPYMLPAVVVMLDALPLTPHGKVDHRALPAPEVAAAPYESPVTPLETAVAAVWEEMLGVRAGRRDNFFDLGGHSLLTPRMVARLAQETGVEVPLPTLFASADLAELAAAMAGARPAAGVDLRAEARLPADFRVAREPRDGPPRRVLLTGATGFLGAHLLAELLTTTQATVHCLVRGPAERIGQVLRAYGLWRDAFAARVVAEPGDLARPGLPDVDADLIVHCGGAVDFARPYSRLKAANVDGTLRLLRLAARTGTPVHHVSTLGVHLTPGERTVREGDPLPDPGRLHLGYDQSKWVADRLAAAARAAGLPVAIHRPARITGDSREGRSPAGDFLHRFLATCARLGSVPDGERLDMAPVDHVAAAIVHLAASRAEGDFHYYNPRTASTADLVRAMTAHGVPVRPAPGAEWRAEVRARLARGEELPIAPFPAFYAGHHGERGPRFDCSATEERLAQAGLICPPAPALLGLYLGRLLDVGALPGGCRA